VAAPKQTSTRSGRGVRIPRRFDDYLPPWMQTATRALAHIPSEEYRRQAIVDPMAQSDALGIPSPATGIEEDPRSQATGDKSPLDHSESLTTNASVCRVYARKPLQDPLRPNTRRSDAHALDPAESSSDFRPRTAPNQGSFHSDIQTSGTAPYYHPFSNPSAAVMMVAYHSGTRLQFAQQITLIARLLGSLGSDLNTLDLGNFDAALEDKKLYAYLASAPKSVFPPSIARPADGNDEYWESFYVNL
jgi:hypothetical protein